MDAPVVTSIAAPGPALGAEIADLLDRVSAARRHPPLGEQKRLALAQVTETGVPSGHGHVFAGLVVRGAGSPELGAYAQLDGNVPRRTYSLEMAVDPGLEDPGPVADALVAAALSEVSQRGGGTVRLWAQMAGPDDDARASSLGFVLERDLVQLRVELPLGDEGDRGAEPIGLRPFRPGLDEDAWLTTNNRAFAAHPEQGEWDRGRLAEREKEPWFDPAGFLVLEQEGRIAGFCWTKIHAEADPPMGEIYVIGIDPDFQGRGLGRALTAAGLDWLSGQGLRIGMLYVDRSNRAALSLYESMGFEEHHVDRAYITYVAAVGPETEPQPTPTR